MRTIIAGSRGVTLMFHLVDAITNCGWIPTTVLSGTASGADKLGETWAINHNIPLEYFPADWETHGKRAGYVRNTEMAHEADALIALWDGNSKGTKHMIDIATKKGLRVYVRHVE